MTYLELFGYLNNIKKIYNIDYDIHSNFENTVSLVLSKEDFHMMKLFTSEDLDTYTIDNLKIELDFMVKKINETI